MCLSGLKCVMLSGGKKTDPNNNSNFGLVRLPGPYVIREVLEKHDIEVEIVDFIQFFTDHQLEELFDFLQDYQPDFITISDTLMDFELVDTLSKTIKGMVIDVPIITGGMNPYTFEHDAVDYRIYSYGENAIIEVLKHHFCQKEMEFEMRGNMKFLNALHSYKAWPKDDYGYRYRKKDHMKSYDIGTLELSRGCRFKCKFCNWPILGIKEDTSQKEIDSVVSILNDNYDQFGISYYMIADDTFNDRTSKLEKLALIAESVKFDVRFSAFMRLDLIWTYSEHVDLMIRAKLTGPHFGVETFNEKCAKIIGKGKQALIAKETLLKLNKAFEDAGLDYHPQCSMIIGLPEETPEECLESQKWLVEEYKKHFVWYPLDIQQTGETLSAFGEDMRKWGMELIDEEIITTDVKSMPTSKWKNKYWDSESAIEMAAELNKAVGPEIVRSWFQGFVNIPADVKRQIPQKYIQQRLKDLR